MASTVKVRTVFERAGDEAAEVAAALVERQRLLIDRNRGQLIIESERKLAIIERERARRRNLDNEDQSTAPGLRATLTEEGYDMALETAGEMGFHIEEASVVHNGLAIITLSDGAYNVSDHSTHFHEHSYLDEQSEVIPMGSAGSFYVANPGVVMIEGLAAQERWLNPTFNPDGTPR
jgi:DNA-binding transcriptional ArsR family regulator